MLAAFSEKGFEAKLDAFTEFGSHERMMTYGGHTYYLYKPATWGKAIQLAKVTYSSYIVQLSNEAEYRAVLDFVQQDDAFPHVVWASGQRIATDVEPNEQFKWPKQYKGHYMKWVAGQPDNACGTAVHPLCEVCTTLQEGGYADVRCEGLELPVLIESNEGPPPPNAQTVFFDPAKSNAKEPDLPAVDHQTAAELLANPTKATDNPLPPINRANGHEEL